MMPDGTVLIGKKSFPIVFSSNAVFQLQLFLRQNKLSIHDFNFGEPDSFQLQLLIWASLEGGRRKFNGRHQAFTVDEVGDMLDAAPDEQRPEIISAVLDIVRAAAPTSDGDDKSKNGQAGSAISKRSSRRRSTSESASTNSGIELSEKLI